MEYQGQPVIILGMGRSGTSMLASLLQTSDVSMYRNSMPAGEINPRGFAEETLMVAFHQKLKRLHYSRFEGDPDYDNPLIDEIRPFESTEDLVKEASVLISVLQKRGLWGWKDPRTVLFIDLWLAVLPTARMIIPLRHPIELFVSYLRRLPNQRLMRRPDQVFRSYTAYHSKILEVVERHREQCCLFYAQTAYQNLECLQTALENFLGEKLRFSEAADAFHREEFTDLGLGAQEHAAFAKFFPTPAAYFDSLNSRAAIGFAGDREQSKPRPELSALNSLAEFLTSPEDQADSAPLFLRVVAPTAEGYSGYLARQLDELFRTVAWLEQQVKSRDGARKHLEQAFDLQKQFIRELESSKTYLLDQLEQHAQALDQQESAKQYFIGQLEQHAQALDQQESAKQYFIGQLEQHAQALDQQKHYILELESAKQYFIGQSEQQAQALDQQKHHIFELESAIAHYQNQIRSQEECIRALRTRKEAFRTLFGFGKTGVG